MIPPAHISEEQLSRLRDRELPDPEQAAVAAHVDGCEDCQARLADAAALSLLLAEEGQRWERELRPDFAAAVMARLPPDAARSSKRPGFAEALLGVLSFKRPALTLGVLGAAVAAALAIVFAPQLQSHDDRLEEATENEAQIHSIEVSSPDKDAVVFESSEGNTVIWMVPADGDDGGSTASPIAPPKAPEQP